MNYGEYDREPAGQVALIGRVKCAPSTSAIAFTENFNILLLIEVIRTSHSVIIPIFSGSFSPMDCRCKDVPTESGQHIGK